MSGRKARVVFMTPIRLTCTIQSTSASAISASGSKEVAPALAKSNRIGPSASFASAFMRRIASRSHTSQ